MKLPININDEVKTALAENCVVVALESTVISHGLPYPLNIELAQSLEAEVRRAGAVPATIAILNGTFQIGLNSVQIEQLADPKTNARKVSRRDIAHTLTTKQPGATTVAGTMIGAHLAGIKVFATGGIGGVHRGAELTFDISADLIELAQTPVAVVCAGAKSILDIPKTLEMLETLGVPIFGYKTKFFPEFYCKGYRYPLEMNIKTPEEIAQTLKNHWNLNLKNGVIISQNPPSELALKSEQIELWINKALKNAEEKGITGKDTTPFLLKEVGLLSKKLTTETNCALLKNNAYLAGNIAHSLSHH